ncbi:MAG: NAD-dependent epimerase/dehydratase family protein [Ferruginibacter sp.]|nr:NAD-dependent epimerase/dehydratase family protein [Ferruginibacter sp.]
MKAIIFGANGQDGHYLTQLLLKNNIEVIAVSRSGNFIKTNITNYEEVSLLIKNSQPNFIFHLAANSTTWHSALFENHQTIATGTLNILEAVKEFSPHSKVFISGSGLQFLNTGNPIKETDPFVANDAYSIGRIQSVYAARYFRTLGIKVYVGYFFNHDSPLRSERHVTKKISEAAKRIAAGSNEKLEIGDISVIKEWSFAGDIVQGIWLFINQDKIFEANISSGIGYSIKEWVETCFGLIGKNFEDYIIHNQNFISAHKILISDNTLIKSIGYLPKINLKDLAKMLINK